MRYIIFGDTGGHFRQLNEALLEIGMTQDFVLPENTCIIHLGDLIHKGLYSTQVLELIENIKLVNDNQWVQLIGNHEAQYLGGQIFWNKTIDKKAQGILQEWWGEGFLKFAYVLPVGENNPAVVQTFNKDYTIDAPIAFTHAGLGQPFLKQFNKNILELEKDFENLALKDAYADGIMLERVYDVHRPVGAVWAHGIHEVWMLWKILNNIPFNQVVGHISPYVFERKAFYPKTPIEFKEVAEIHEKERVTAAPLNDEKNKWMFFADPGYEKNAYTEKQPWINCYVSC